MRYAYIYLKAILVGKDVGAFVAYLVPVIYPERVSAIVVLGVPFMLPGSSVQGLLASKGFYVSRFHVCIQIHSLSPAGLADYIHSGAMKQIIPNLELRFVAEGCHFVPEQFPEQINQLIIPFLDKHSI
ncbi:hypothetical protein FEM48_Zijuj04G0116100 [Ziziphus jujuba var. spinosa]|uniref:Bifunctional epoxide hydrolase 2-like n=1 Tax=Ziziphus jujuba var. spinosa TaxID=714518 RepID=A0A978VJN1_ZIZJJ|nr:hypothetical protein FEM48_Zijuj04G0116100 [Ziziphus jujuba var. spinosa]